MWLWTEREEVLQISYFSRYTQPSGAKANVDDSGGRQCQPAITVTLT